MGAGVQRWWLDADRKERECAEENLLRRRVDIPAARVLDQDDGIVARLILWLRR